MRGFGLSLTAAKIQLIYTLYALCMQFLYIFNGWVVPVAAWSRVAAWSARVGLAQRATSEERARKERGRCGARFPLAAVVGSVGLGCQLAGLAPRGAAGRAYAAVPRFFSAFATLRLPLSAVALSVTLWLPFRSLRFAASTPSASGKAQLWRIAEKKARLQQL